MQLNRVGIGLIAFFLLAGLGMFLVPLALGVDAQVVAILGLTGGIWIVVALGLLWFARRQKRKAAHQDWIFQSGLKGRATVVEAGSHATVNEMPLMKIAFDLDVPGVEAKRVSRRQVMSVFAARRLEPGLVLPVYVNPEDHDDLVLVW
jgi:preprotein translocase subunit YajC